MRRTWYLLAEVTHTCRSCCSSPPRHRRRGSTALVIVAFSSGCRRIRVTLISDSNVAYYSGMLPGCVAGLYKEKDIQIDLVSFSRWCKVRLHQSRCIGLDPHKNVVFTEGTSSLTRHSNQLPVSDGVETKYDIISFNVGSMNRGTTVPGVQEHALCTRPISALTSKLQAFQQHTSVGAKRRVVVVRLLRLLLHHLRTARLIVLYVLQGWWWCSRSRTCLCCQQMPLPLHAHAGNIRLGPPLGAQLVDAQVGDVKVAVTWH